MKATTDRILQLLDDPEELEALYRQAPEAFRESLGEAFRTDPDSVALRIWRARLEYREPGQGAILPRRLGYAIAIALAVGALVRLPALWLGEVLPSSCTVVGHHGACRVFLDQASRP